MNRDHVSWRVSLPAHTRGWRSATFGESEMRSYTDTGETGEGAVERRQVIVD